MNKQTQEALNMAGYDLDGVIADVEKFDNFDDVCLQTIKRVRRTIAEALEQPAQEIVELMDLVKYGQSFTKIAAEPAQEDVPILFPRWDNGEPVEVRFPKQALEQPAQEPVACTNKYGCKCNKHYTYPAQPLSDVLDLIPNAEAKEFWKRVYENGITAQEIANELSDMNIMIENVPKIVYAVTGGLLSKATYEAQTVISRFNDYVDDVVKEAIEDYKEENEIEPLSDDEIKLIFSAETGFVLDDSYMALLDFARAIEQAHGIGVK
jgi:hypothetical protein